MLTAAVLLFLVGAIGGVTMAVIHFRGQNPSFMLAGLHGVFVASGLVLLIIALLGTGFWNMAGLALVIFLLAALGGFWLLSIHLQDKRLPSPVVIAHGSAAAIAFILLLTVWLQTGA